MEFLYGSWKPARVDRILVGWPDTRWEVPMPNGGVTMALCVLSVVAAAGHATALGDDATPVPLNTSQCSKNFSAPSKDYGASKIELGGFKPPADGSVFFQVKSSPKQLGDGTFSPGVDLVPILVQGRLWWQSGTESRQREVVLQSRSTPGPRDVALQTFPAKETTLASSGTIGLLPVLAQGNRFFCLVSQLSLNWKDAKAPESSFSEEWYGTTTRSPVYAVARITWKKKN
jgi:hypothetical protein